MKTSSEYDFILDTDIAVSIIRIGDNSFFGIYPIVNKNGEKLLIINPANRYCPTDLEYEMLKYANTTHIEDTIIFNWMGSDKLLSWDEDTIKRVDRYLNQFSYMRQINLINIESSIDIGRVLKINQDNTFSPCKYYEESIAYKPKSENINIIKIGDFVLKIKYGVETIYTLYPIIKDYKLFDRFCMDIVPFAIELKYEYLIQNKLDAMVDQIKDTLKNDYYTKKEEDNVYYYNNKKLLLTYNSIDKTVRGSGYEVSLPVAVDTIGNFLAIK